MQAVWLEFILFASYSMGITCTANKQYRSWPDCSNAQADMIPVSVAKELCNNNIGFRMLRFNSYFILNFVCNTCLSTCSINWMLIVIIFVHIFVFSLKNLHWIIFLITFSLEETLCRTFISEWSGEVKNPDQCLIWSSLVRIVARVDPYCKRSWLWYGRVM